MTQLVVFITSQPVWSCHFDRIVIIGLVTENDNPQLTCPSSLDHAITVSGHLAWNTIAMMSGKKFHRPVVFLAAA